MFPKLGEITTLYLSFETKVFYSIFTYENLGMIAKIKLPKMFAYYSIMEMLSTELDISEGELVEFDKVDKILRRT